MRALPIQRTKSSLTDYLPRDCISSSLRVGSRTERNEDQDLVWQVQESSLPSPSTSSRAITSRSPETDLMRPQKAQTREDEFLAAVRSGDMKHIMSQEYADLKMTELRKEKIMLAAPSAEVLSYLLEEYGPPEELDHLILQLAFKSETEKLELLLSTFQADFSKWLVRNVEDICKSGSDQTVMLLIEYGLAEGKNGNLCLYGACSAGRTSLVRKLLSLENVDPNAAFKEVLTTSSPLEAAIHSGNEELVSLLLSDDRLDPSSFNNRALQGAVLLGRSNMVQLLLSDTRVDPQAAFALSLGSGEAEIAQMLYETGEVDLALTRDVALDKIITRKNVLLLKWYLSVDLEVQITSKILEHASADRTLKELKNSTVMALPRAEMVDALLRDARVDPSKIALPVEHLLKILIPHLPELKDALDGVTYLASQFRVRVTRDRIIELASGTSTYSLLLQFILFKRPDPETSCKWLLQLGDGDVFWSARTALDEARSAYTEYSVAYDSLLRYFLREDSETEDLSSWEYVLDDIEDEDLKLSIVLIGAYAGKSRLEIDN